MRLGRDSIGRLRLSRSDRGVTKWTVRKARRSLRGPSRRFCVPPPLSDPPFTAFTACHRSPRRTLSPPSNSTTRKNRSPRIATASCYPSGPVRLREPVRTGSTTNSLPWPLSLSSPSSASSGSSSSSTSGERRFRLPRTYCWLWSSSRSRFSWPTRTRA